MGEETAVGVQGDYDSADWEGRQNVEKGEGVQRRDGYPCGGDGAGNSDYQERHGWQGTSLDADDSDENLRHVGTEVDAAEGRGVGGERSSGRDAWDGRQKADDEDGPDGVVAEDDCLPCNAQLLLARRCRI